MSFKGIYSEDKNEVDEIWLVFDAEVEIKSKWEEYFDIIKKLQKRCKHTTVRLFMTKGCIEYFFLLHYEKTNPVIITAADKDKIIRKLCSNKYCPGYKKGDKETTQEIAKHYHTAIKNGVWSLKQIDPDLTTTGANDETMKRLYLTDRTFTNAHEAIQFLLKLKNK